MSDRFVKLRAELTIARGWIRTLIDVSENDPDATMSWFIPALTLDYEGYVMDEFWENERKLFDSNEEKIAYFQSYAQTIIDSLTRRIAATRERVSYETYMESSDQREG